eukprot:scaffold332_cov105-Isochrysis_galbana.AAC.8
MSSGEPMIQASGADSASQARELTQRGRSGREVGGTQSRRIWRPAARARADRKSALPLCASSTELMLRHQAADSHTPSADHVVWPGRAGPSEARLSAVGRACAASAALPSTSIRAKQCDTRLS